MGLSKDQIARYGRQLILPEIGVRGQERLRRSRVLLVGAGGLGSPAALYLAAAGVGRLVILDQETVALSNLHRQILHTTDRVGRPKSASAAQTLAALNPEVEVVARQVALQADNALAFVREADLVLDGSDNVATRYLVNDACVLSGKSFIYGGVIGFMGQVMTVIPRQSACFRCVFPEPPAPEAVQNCQEAGVLGAAAGVIGSLMAHEALKVLVGVGEPLQNRLLVFDGLAGRVREVEVVRNPACAVCGPSPTIHQLVDGESEVCVDTEQEGRWPRSR